MADTTPETTEQAQAVQVVPEAATTATPTATDQPSISFEDAVEQLVTAQSTGASSDEISRLEALVKAANPDNTPAEQVEAVEPNEEQAPTEPQETVEPVEPSEPEESSAEEPAEDTKEVSKRIKLSHLPENERALIQSANLLAKATGKSFNECWQIVNGNQASAPEQEQLPEQEPQPTPPEIAQLQSEIAEIEAKLDAAAENGELFTPEIKDLNRQQSKAYAKLAALEARQEAVKEAASTVNAQMTAAQIQAERTKVLVATVNDYPGLKDTKSTIFQLARDLALAAQNPDHPDHTHSVAIDAPKFFGEKAANLLGIKPVSSKEQVPPSVPQKHSTTTQQTRTVQPAPGSRQSAPPPPAKTIADKIAEAEALAEAATTGGSYVFPSSPTIIIRR